MGILKYTNITNWVRENAGKHQCQCLGKCERYIDILRDHYRQGIPKYIKGHGRIGTRNSEEHNEKISLRKIGIKRSKEATNKIVKKLIGQKRSEETKQEMRELAVNRNRGRKHTEAEKEKMRGKVGIKSPKFRKEITRERVFNTIYKIIEQEGSDIGKQRIKELMSKELGCGVRTIFSRFGCQSMERLLSMAPIKISLKNVKYSEEQRQNMRKEKRSDITKTKILQTINDIIDKEGEDIGKKRLKMLVAKDLRCGQSTIINRFHNNIGEILNQYNITVGVPKQKGRIGVNETQILDNYEQKIECGIDRQKYVAGKFLDGYIPEINTVIEVDESHHYNRQGELRVEDIIRENKIKEVLGCNFVRIKDNISQEQERLRI